VNLSPDLGAKGDGGVFEGGVEGRFHALGGGGLDGFDHGVLREGFDLHVSIVRRRGVNMCKLVTRVCAPFDPGRYGVFQDQSTLARISCDHRSQKRELGHPATIHSAI